ncbi:MULTISPECIES: hypothetical protein [Acidobacteriaceae]|uniref:hypothetical protein n=1 Tax=Acidobacteriaceae TaxID=204434 RepID=UPI00131EC990|nr:MULTISPECIES: hypothetical protein [Acidobacteriaceae]MDW5265677.1 hypothetical protein [Edaphobacter sp.]
MKARVERIAALALLGVLLLPAAALAQTASSPTLNDVLQQLDNNLHRYDAQVPDFYCSEHVVSSLTYGNTHQISVNDSIFRLKRVTHPSGITTLDESRETKAVNGAVAEKQIQGPTTLSGVFSGGLDVVSLDQQSCMSYALEPTKPGKPYVIQFATLPGKHDNCLLTEESNGRVFIDPATMQVKRLELVVPHHIIVPQTVGAWRITIVYAPMLLDGRTFWMPTTIASTADSTYEGTETEWAFNAAYSNYHKLEVSFRILPPSDSATQ